MDVVAVLNSVSFINATQESINYWNVRISSYANAVETGRCYAHEVVMLLRQHNDLIGSGLLFDIAESISFSDKKRIGYAVGFFSEIEKQLALNNVIGRAVR